MIFRPQRLYSAPQKRREQLACCGWSSPAQGPREDLEAGCSRSVLVGRSHRTYLPLRVEAPPWNVRCRVPVVGCSCLSTCGAVCRTCCRAPSWRPSGAFRRPTALRMSSPCPPVEQRALKALCGDGNRDPGEGSKGEEQMLSEASDAHTNGLTKRWHSQKMTKSPTFGFEDWDGRNCGPHKRYVHV